MLDAGSKKLGLFVLAGFVSLYAAAMLLTKLQFEVSRNLFFFIIAFIIASSAGGFAIKKYMINTVLKNINLSERQQSEALLDSLNIMVDKLEYRDNVLVVEKKLAEQASRAKSDFLISMSHELRTPMHAILNFAEMGKNKIYDADLEKIKLYFIRIEESGERLVRLIDNLLDLTRLEEGKAVFKFQNNDIMNCLSYVCDEMASLLTKKSIKIKIQNNNSKTIFIFDKDHIISVLINLISNAVKYSPPDSTINIIIETGKFAINGVKTVSGIKISVIDQGSGIAEGEMEMIFNKFIQGSIKAAKEVGSGLGLAIVKEIIIAHGGEIWAENAPGAGACISFVIPDNNKLADII